MPEKSVTVWLRVLSLLAVIAVGAVVFVVRGVYNAEARIVELENNIAESLEGTVSDRGMERVLEEYALEFGVLESQLVKEDDIVSFIEYIEASADSAGVSLEVRSVTNNNAVKADDKGKVSAIDAHDHVAVAVRAEGAWSSIIEFVGGIEYASRGVYIKQTTLVHLDAEEGDEVTIPARWVATLSFGVILDTF